VTAVLICLENSFWCLHDDVNSEEAFKDSWRIYVSSGRKQLVDRDISGQQIAVKMLTDSEEVKSTFLKIILQNLLRASLLVWTEGYLLVSTLARPI
jgi:hypothetical protein